MNSEKVVLGILGGVAAGALLGVLLAPEKGIRTRRRIMGSGRSFANDIKDKFEDIYQEATEKYEDLLHNAKDLASKNQMR